MSPSNPVLFMGICAGLSCIFLLDVYWVGCVACSLLFIESFYSILLLIKTSHLAEKPAAQKADRHEAVATLGVKRGAPAKPKKKSRKAMLAELAILGHELSIEQAAALKQWAADLYAAKCAEQSKDNQPTASDKTSPSIKKTKNSEKANSQTLSTQILTRDILQAQVNLKALEEEYSATIKRIEYLDREIKRLLSRLNKDVKAKERSLAAKKVEEKSWVKNPEANSLNKKPLQSTYLALS